jgi:N-acyl-D-amino-acid deacylase
LAAVVWYWRSACDFLITDVRHLQEDEISECRFHVGIKGDQISYVGRQRVRARTIIPGAGLILTPGLIDVNSCGWLSEEAAMLKLRDGVTTFLNAHGDSFKAAAKKVGASERLNYATSVGLIPAHARGLTGPELIAALEDSLRYGAYTVSLSPEYNAATTPEIIAELSRHFANRNVLFTFHLRYSSEAEELAGVREAIDCAAQGNPVHILHITSTGATFHPEEAREMIDAAVGRGLRITYDFYPYTAWSSSIHRARFAGDWLRRYQTDFSRVHIAGEAGLTKERFEELIDDPADRNVLVDSIPQATVDYYALGTSCPIGTDSEAGPDTIHPRGVGSFARFINDYVDTGKVPFGKAMHRFSTATAELYAPHIPGLAKRGAIRVGYEADLVLWDRAKIKSRADYTHPLEPSTGVVAAFVNGVPQILDGQPVAAAAASGMHLKGVRAR